MSNSIVETYNSLEDNYLSISKEYLRLDEACIEEALIKHTSIYAFFASVLAHAKRSKDLLEVKIEMSQAKYKEERRTLMVSSGQRPTQAALDNYVLTVPEFVELKEQQVETEHKYNLAKNIVSSLDHQKDMLIQLSANKRAETKLHEL